jgi:glycosyltransferase involved in cell wall biosynthesis
VKVLLVHDYGHQAGGGEVQTSLLRAGLSARGIDVRMFASRAPVAGVSMGAEYTCFGTTGPFRTVLQAANPMAPIALRRALASFRPDVVHVRMFLTQIGPLVLPLLRAVPAVHHVVWYRPVCPRGTKLLPDGSPCRERRGLACLRNGCLGILDWGPLIGQLELYERWRSVFDLVVANSEAVRKRLVAEGIEPVEVIWNGVPEREPRPPLADPPEFAFAGRLVWEKGVDVLLRAFARVRERVPTARLVVAGAGPERANLERLTSELRLDDATRFLGHLGREEVERQLEPAWAQVVPGRWEEPFGLTVSEAMMRGTAVVASSIGGPAEIVAEQDTGFLVPPGDVGAMAAALTRLACDRALAERMGGRARTFALARLGTRRFIDDWVGVYDRLIMARR